MSNPKLDYNAAVRSSLPSGVTYSNNRYRFLNKLFVSFKRVKWYRDYIAKTAPSGSFNSFSADFSNDFAVAT